MLICSTSVSIGCILSLHPTLWADPVVIISDWKCSHLEHIPEYLQLVCCEGVGMPLVNCVLGEFIQMKTGEGSVATLAGMITCDKYCLPADLGSSECGSGGGGGNDG